MQLVQKLKTMEDHVLGVTSLDFSHYSLVSQSLQGLFVVSKDEVCPPDMGRNLNSNAVT